MKKFVVIAFFSISSQLFAQSDLGFAPIGAKWYYTIPAFFFLDPVTYVKYEVTDDTIINGKLASVVHRTHGFDVSNLTNPFFLHYDSNRVFWYNNYSGTFNLLYDFNAEAGESWTVRLPCDTIQSPGQISDSIHLSVLSTDSIIVNGTSLKKLMVQIPGSGSITLIEKIGMLYEGYPNSIFFCDGGIVDPSPWQMRCYEDSVLGFLKGPDPDPCDTTYIQVGLDNTLQFELTIHPNPAKNQILLKASDILKAVEIKDLSGTTIIHQDINTNAMEFDVTNIPNGLYLISTVSDKGYRQTQKIIIQK